MRWARARAAKAESARRRRALGGKQRPRPPSRARRRAYGRARASTSGARRRQTTRTRAPCLLREASLRRRLRACCAPRRATTLGRRGAARRRCASWPRPRARAAAASGADFSAAALCARNEQGRGGEAAARGRGARPPRRVSRTRRCHAATSAAPSCAVAAEPTDVARCGQRTARGAEAENAVADTERRLIDYSGAAASDGDAVPRPHRCSRRRAARFATPLSCPVRVSIDVARVRRLQQDRVHHECRGAAGGGAPTAGRPSSSSTDLRKAERAERQRRQQLEAGEAATRSVRGQSSSRARRNSRVLVRACNRIRRARLPRENPPSRRAAAVGREAVSGLRRQLAREQDLQSAIRWRAEAGQKAVDDLQGAGAIGMVKQSGGEQPRAR